MIYRVIAFAIIACALCSTSGGQNAPAPNEVRDDVCTEMPPLPPIPKGPVGDLDQLFIDAYMSRCNAVLATAQPYIVVSGSSLILHRNGKASPSQRVIPDSYHALKDIAHLPFTIYLLLSPLANSPTQLTDEQIKPLLVLRDKIDAANAALATGNYTEDEVPRQKNILNSSAKLVSSAIQTRKITPDELARFAKSMGPLILQNAWDAGCQQVRATHAQVMKWKNELSRDEWQHLIVMNRARHQARYRNVATQYFHWLFDDKAPTWSYPGESLRVVYAESLGRNQEAKDEFATVLIDAEASKAFFGDQWRLTEDILSGGAESCIAQLPSEDRIYK